MPRNGWSSTSTRGSVGSVGHATRLAAVHRWLFVLAIVATSTRAAAAQPIPPELTQPVNDFAHVIDEPSRTEIERRIVALKRATGDVVVVATIETFAPYADIREYAVRMFENRGRGIGDKGKDNGVLVLLAVN